MAEHYFSTKWETFRWSCSPSYYGCCRNRNLSAWGARARSAWMCGWWLRPTGSTVAGTLEEVERQRILRALRETGAVIGGEKGAAARLGLKRTTLLSKMQRLGISRYTKYAMWTAVVSFASMVV